MHNYIANFGDLFSCCSTLHTFLKTQEGNSGESGLNYFFNGLKESFYIVLESSA